MSRYTDIAAKSQGVAEEKFGYYLQSLQAKINALKASLENLAATTISDELYASVLDVTKGMVDATAASRVLKGALAGLATAGSIYAFEHLAGYLNDATHSFANLNEAMNMVNNNTAGTINLNRLIDLTSGLSQSQTRLILSTNNLNDAQRIAILRAQGMSAAEARLQLQTWGITTAQQGATAATLTFSSAIRGLYLTLAANPLFVVTAAVTLGVTLWGKYKSAQEEAAQAAENARQKYDTLADEVSSLNAELETTKQRLKELNAIGVDNLSLVEQEEYNKLVKTNDELERELRIKEALAKVAAQEAAQASSDALSKKSQNSVTQTDNFGNAKKVDSIDYLEELVNRAERQKQMLADARAELTTFEDSWTGTDIDMVKSSDWQYLNDVLTNAEDAVGKTESSIAEAYEAVETDAKGLVDSFGNVVEGYEDMYSRIEGVRDKVDTYFNQEPKDTTKASLEAQFGKNQISTLSDEDIEIAYTIRDIGDMDFNELKQAISDAKKEADEPIEVKTDTKSTLESLEELSDGFNKLSSIYEDIRNKGDFDYGSLIDEDFVKIFGSYKEEYQNFIDTVSKSPTDINACQSAFDNLVSTWLYAQEPLKNITDETYALTVAWLEQNGVANANEVATSALIRKKEEAFFATNDLTDASTDEINVLLAEAKAAKLSESAIYKLRLALITANDSKLDFSQQIEAIKNMGLQAGVTAAQISAMNAVTNANAQVKMYASGSARRLTNSGKVKDSELAGMTGQLTAQAQATVAKQAAKEMYAAIADIASQPIDLSGVNYSPKSPSGGSGGSGSKGSSSSKDPYVADIDKYKELSDAVDEVETKLKHLDQVYSHTDNINERIALKEAEIKLYKEEQDALTALNNARDKEIQENVNKLRKQGFQIEYDPKSDNLQIKNREYLNKISQDDIQTTEKLIKATEELNDANKESAEKWRELTYSIVDTNKALTELKIDRYEKYITAQEHLIKLLSNRKDTVGLDIPIYNDIMKTKLNEWKDLVKDGYEKNKEQIQKLEKEWMDYYDKRLEREKEILEAQLSDNDKALDGVLNMLDEQSNAIQKQIDALKSANDERREALDLQKAQAALDKARNQRTRLVLRRGKGWVWESNQDEIQSAEQDLADKRFDATISSLEKQKEALDEIKEMWSEIPEIYDKEQAKLMASQLLGKNWEEQVLDGRLDIYEKFKDNYIGIQEDIADKTDELENHMNESYLRMVKIFEAFVKKFSTDLNPEATITSKYQLGEGNKAWYVNKDGKAPSGAKLGDIILTRGGTYKITAKDENGKFTSTKLDDRSSDIKDNMWGRVVADSTDELVDVLGLTTDASKDIVDAAEKQTEQIKNSIITENGLAKFLSENSNLTDEEIDALIDSADFTDENTESTDENTIAIDGLTDELKNFSLEKPIEEFPEDIFDDLDWDSMTTDEKNYINQLKDAYEIALRNGNDYMADKILSFLDDFKNGYGDEYIQIGKDVLAAATTPFGEVTKSTANSADRLSSLEKQLESAKNGGSSQDYIDRLERTIAIEKYGAGTDQYSSSNGYVTQTIISSKDEKEMYMTSDEIKQKYDYENGNKNNGYDPDKMAQTIADRIVESQNNPNSVWGSVVTNDLDKSLTDKVKTDDKSSLGNSGNNKTTTVKLSDSDSDAIKAAQKAYNEAKAKGDTAGMEKAHADAEAIRNKNGYSGGDDGSKVIATSNDKVTKELKNNSGSLSDNSDSNYYAGDSAKEAADKVADSAQTMADSVKDAAKSFLSSGGSSSSKSSGSSKSSSKSNSSSVKDSMSAIVPVINSGSGSSSSSKTSTATTVKNAISTAQKVVSLFKNAPKKASGGINLDPNIYNVDEIDPELLIHPDKGRYVVMEKGGSILPAEPTKRLWELGENPEAFIQSYMPQNVNQSLERNNQFVYNSRKETTQSNTYNYQFGNVEVEGVRDVMGFLDGLRSLPNRASQFMSVDRNRK